MPEHYIPVLAVSVSSEGSGESAHMRRLARAFAAMDVDEGSCLALLDSSAWTFIRDICYKYKDLVCWPNYLYMRTA